MLNDKAMSHPDSQTKSRLAQAHKSGTSIAQLVTISGYHRNSITRWIKASKKDPDFVKPRKSGSGRPASFSGKTGRKLLQIISKPASKFGFETDLWTTGRIQKVCEDELDLTTSKMSIFRLLKKYDQSYKKPEKRYYEASEEKQGDWVENVLPRIIQIQKKKRAIMYFEDESCVQLSPVLGKTWGPIGKTTIQKVTGNRGSVSAISAVSKSGNLFFNIHDSGKRFNAEDIIAFLSALMTEHHRRHLIVIMDRAPCHTARKVQDFVLSKSKLDVFYLPARSPEFNPAEKIWHHLKHHELKSHKAKTTDDLKILTRNKMKNMAKNTTKIANIFKRCENSNLYEP
jgi:transposase